MGDLRYVSIDGRSPLRPSRVSTRTVSRLYGFVYICQVSHPNKRRFPRVGFRTDVRTAIVGAGPTGLFLGLALARRGHSVTVVDRDPGPASIVEWTRKGVMQFRLPHYFRPQVRNALLEEAPEVVDGLLAAGALPAPVNPRVPEIVGFRMRRVLFERVLRAAVAAEPNVSLVTGHAERVLIANARVSGLVVDGAQLDSDLVIDASGRSSRLTDSVRAPALGGDSGFAYVCREYQLRPGAEPGPLNSPPGWVGVYDGYLVIIFLQDAGTFQVLIVRRSDDHDLAQLRRDVVFDVAAGAIPLIATWVDPDRATPHSSAMAGAGLHNSYRGQCAENGDVAVEGVLFVGDAVLTTNPAAGRGVSTSLMQAQRLLRALDEHGRDFTSVSLDFDQWCLEAMKPWFDDHVRWDAGLISRWRGEPIDFSSPLPSDLICSLAEIDPSVMPIVGPYMAMAAGPSILSNIEQRAREALQSGFRPAVPSGPTRDELVDLISAGNGT
jgi:2-polyprenyl-6-methoxyphenol hydroxylase-like FAD-dependent oxidoreductase